MLPIKVSPGEESRYLQLLLSHRLQNIKELFEWQRQKNPNYSQQLSVSVGKVQN